MVVRKGYEHPEIVMKILSVLFDYSRYEAEDADEVNSYFALNVDPTARPLMINVDYNEATYMVTRHIREALYSPGDAKTREDLSAIMLRRKSILGMVTGRFLRRCVHWRRRLLFRLLWGKSR